MKNAPPNHSQEPPQNGGSNGGLKAAETTTKKFFAGAAYLGMRATRYIGTQVSTRLAEGIEDVIGRVAGNEMERTLDVGRHTVGATIGALRSAAGRSLAACMDTAKNLRLIDQLNVRNLPELLDDPEEDAELKFEMIDFLDSRAAVKLPFAQELEFIANLGFNMGIPPHKLIEFLETEEILEILIDGVLTSHHSKYRPTTMTAAVSSSVESATLKLKSFIDRLDKMPVTEDCEKILLAYFEHFKSTYDPKKREYTISEFVKRLQEEFPRYDVISWLEKNKHLFTSLLRGYKCEALPEETVKTKKHIEDMVNDTYEELAKKDPKKFIAVHLEDFIHSHNQATSDLYISVSDVGHIPATPSEKSILLDVQKLQQFFDEVLPKIRTKDLGAARLRQLIAEVCVEELRKHKKVRTLFVRDGARIIGEDFNTLDEIIPGLTQVIKEQAKTLSSSIDITDILADPEETPLRIQNEYEEFFDRNGYLRRENYEKSLRSLFELGARDGSKEEMASIEERTKEVFEEVEKYLVKAHEDLGIPATLNFETVNNSTNYAELVEIACTAETKEERFAARRKLELVWLVYSCMYSPRFVFRKKDAKEVKRKMESESGGLKVNNEQELEELRFSESIDGNVRILDTDEDPTEEEIGHSVNLIPATFGGIDCYLLPANIDEEEGDGDHEYMGTKSIYSMISKLIRKEKVRAKDITDLIRMTFVVDSPDELIGIQRQLETHYVSFGRELRKENRYGEFVNVPTTGTQENQSSSDEYRSLRYVVDIPIESQNQGGIYLAPVEIRVLLKEDLAKERSDNNDASHKKYEERRLEECMERLDPPEMAPNLYKINRAHHHDVFKREKRTIKKRSDFGAQAAA